jgi:hypothetical protein
MTRVRSLEGREAGILARMIQGMFRLALGRALNRTCSPYPRRAARESVRRGRRDGERYAVWRSRGSVTAPGVAIARRVASARYAAGSTPASFADSSSE